MATPQSQQTPWRGATVEELTGSLPPPVRRAVEFCVKLHSRRSVHLVLSTLLGVIGVYIWNSKYWSEKLFGENWQDSWEWWLIAVPLYIYIGIYFARYVGSFLVQTWAKEISQSPITHKVLVNLAGGVLRDPAIPALLASVMDQEIVRSSMCDVTTTVLSSPQVQDATALTSAAVLRHPCTLEASAAAAGRLMRNPQLPLDLEACLDSTETSRIVTKQVCKLLQNDDVAEAATDFLQNLLSNPVTSQVMKDRAVSFIQDPKIFRAGGYGLVESLKPRSIPRCCGPTDTDVSPNNYETADEES